MYKTISKKIIKYFFLNYDLLNSIMDDNEELPVREWVEKYRNVVPAKDIIWILGRPTFIPEKNLRLFVIWCAREALKLVKTPDERSINVCNVAERYVNGEATKKEFDIANDAANDVVNIDWNDKSVAGIYSLSAYCAAKSAAQVVSVVTFPTCASNIWNIANNSALAAAYKASGYSIYEAACNIYVGNAHNDADYAVAFAAQIDKLLTYFE
jgi:hypothetical protein